MTPRGVVDATWRAAWRPDPTTTATEWADRYRILAGRATAEAGRYRSARTPYVREILDGLSASSPLQRVIVMKAARLGLTETACNWLGYVMHEAPAPFLYVAPTLQLAQRLSRQTIDPLIAETPVLRDRVATPRSRGTVNTVLLKEFPGGLLVLTGANSAAGLRSMAARFLVFDEVDAYPSDVRGEGDPLALAEARARTFGHRRKVLVISTPTVAGRSRIEREFAVTDQRRFFVPCPTCGAFQVLEFARLTWTPGRPDTVRYTCTACGAKLGEAVKPTMLAKGEWRATAVGDDPAVAGFHLSALYSPLGWFSWADIARAAEDAARDPQKHKTFANTILGEAYAEAHEAPDWHRLRERQAGELGVVPPGALFLTAGVDMQADRLEAYVWGWGRGRRRWLVDVAVCDGAVAGDAPWTALAAAVARTWPTADGAHRLPLARVALDTGYAPVRAHTWARAQAPGLVVLVRGGAAGPALVTMPRTVDAVDTAARTRRRRRGLRVWQVNVHALKVELYGALNLEAPAPGMPTPPGWVSLPAVGDEVCRQLVAEALVRRRVRGIDRGEWVTLYRRNEALDCAVYARAAAYLVGLDRFGDEDWRRLEAPLGVVPPPPEAGPPPAPPEAGGPAPASSSPAPTVVPAPTAAPPVTWRRSRYWRR